MPGIQLPIGVDMVNPVPADFKYGPYATLVAAKAAIPLVLRFDGLTVKINGLGEYWWLAADLSDSGLIAKTGGSGGTFSLPIVRYVYLVQDASDAVLMGGTSSNVYTTFQTAYTAANALQVALGGTNIVIIQVGNITAATAGNLTLTADYNRFIEINGISLFNSVLGTIIATNAAGNGFRVGVNAGNPVIFSNVAIGNISTNATGTTGNSGTVAFRLMNVQLGAIDTSITNVLNTTGLGGTFTLNTIFTNFSIIGSITTSSKSTTANAGSISISTTNMIINGTITTAQNNPGGGIAISAIGRVQVSGININSITTSTFITLINTDVTVTNISLDTGSTTSFTNCKFTSGIQISTISIIPITNTMLRCITLNTLTTQDLVKTLANGCVLSRISNLGSNSRLSTCTIDGSVAPAGVVINGIGTGCSFYNCAVLSGSFSFDNPSPVTVVFTTNFSSFENAPTANVTLI